MTTRPLLAAGLVAGLLAQAGCVDHGSRAEKTATIAIGYRAQAAPSSAARAPVASGITRVSLTVSAVDMGPITADLPLDGTVIEIAVPAGRGRLFAAEGYTGAARTHAGSTAIAELVAGTRTRVTIPLDPIAGDVTPPTVVATSPADGATGVPLGAAISVSFSEAMNPATIGAATFQVRQGATPVAGAIAYAGNVATFTPAASLQGLTAYTVTVTGGAGGVADLAGNPLAADVTFSFTTVFVDLVPPTIVATSPADGATGVAVGAAISVTFSEAMNPATIWAATFQVRQGTTPVAGAIAYAGNVATFTPAESLQGLTAYTVTVTGGAGGVADLAGNPLAANVTFGFTTAPVALPEAWRALSQTGAPSARHYHVTVWAGPPVSRMIVWGGGENPASGGMGGPVDTGGRYDPATDAWAATATLGSPGPLLGATAVWCGATTPPVMLVWGGGSSAGGRYDPAGDAWAPMNVGSPNLPAARTGNTAVWTGSQLIVWGGAVAGPPPIFIPIPVNTGGIYDPSADDWQAVTTTGAPSPRTGHTAVWTGTAMIVWGGDGSARFGDGGVYHPSTGWSATGATGAPSARAGHTAVWTGTRMIVWGGTDAAGNLLADGGAYDPATDTWTPLPAANAPSPRTQHTATWTGSEMVVWGGFAGFGGSPIDRIFLGDGAAYAPASGSWRTLLATGAPVKRADHGAVWSGTETLVWGGITNKTVVDTPWALLDSGAGYRPPQP